MFTQINIFNLFLIENMLCVLVVCVLRVLFCIFGGLVDERDLKGAVPTLTA